MRFAAFTTVAALAAVPMAWAQTSTDCNPTEKSCPADTGLDATTFSCDFTKGSSAAASWTEADGTSLSYGSKGAEFVISKNGQAPTISTDFYFLFGTVEVTMQAAAGTGIVSSVVLESDDLDEIDLEWLGGDTTEVETNYFGKGNTTTYDRAIYYPVTAPQTNMITYKIDWTSKSTTFYVNGVAVRTLNYEDANGGKNYPQTPMRLKLGNWAGGAPGEPAGTVEWAGGATDFSKGPFTMYVQSVKITNANPAKSYEYGDKTGSWESIKIIGADNSASSASGIVHPSTKASSGTVSGAIPTSSLSVSDVKQTGAVVSSTSSGRPSGYATGIIVGAGYQTAGASGAGAVPHSTTPGYGALGATGVSSTLITTGTAGCASASAGSGSGSYSSGGYYGGNLTTGGNSSSPSPIAQSSSGAAMNTATTALFSLVAIFVGFSML